MKKVLLVSLGLALTGLMAYYQRIPGELAAEVVVDNIDDTEPVMPTPGELAAEGVVDNIDDTELVMPTPMSVEGASELHGEGWAKCSSRSPPCICSTTAQLKEDVPDASYKFTAMWVIGIGRQSHLPVPKSWTPPGTSYGTRYLYREARSILPAPVSFNPGLLRLPSALAATLHPDAYFLSIARHWRPACWALASAGEAANRTGVQAATILVLDRDLKVLLTGTAPRSLEDFRFSFLQGKILLTGAEEILRPNGGTTGGWLSLVYELRLKVYPPVVAGRGRTQCPTNLLIEMLPWFPVYERNASLSANKNNDNNHEQDSNDNTGQTRHGQQRKGVRDENDHATTSIRGKNLGLYFNKGELQLLWWLSNPVDVRRLADPMTKLVTDVQPAPHRSNGNPIPLPELDAFLAIGHLHTPGRTAKGRTYIHRFVIFDAKPPYRWLRATRPFCFPAVSNNSHFLRPSIWCEKVQMAVSMVLDGDDLLVTYGLSDCEAGIARFPLRAVLESATSDWQAVYMHSIHSRGDAPRVVEQSVSEQTSQGAAAT